MAAYPMIQDKDHSYKLRCAAPSRWRNDETLPKEPTPGPCCAGLSYPNPGATTVKIRRPARPRTFAKMATACSTRSQNSSISRRDPEIEVVGPERVQDAPVTATRKQTNDRRGPVPADGFGGRLRNARVPGRPARCASTPTRPMDELGALAEQLAALPNQLNTTVEPITARKISVLKRGDVTKPVGKSGPGAILRRRGEDQFHRSEGRGITPRGPRRRRC